MKEREPSYVFSEETVADKSAIAKEFLARRTRQNASVLASEGTLIKRFYNIDHNAYLDGALSAKTKELMGLVASAVLRCDDCISYHIIQSYRLGCDRNELEETLNIALVVGGSIFVPHLRRAFELLDQLYYV